jgi:outer membrane lipoprotein SlyB
MTMRFTTSATLILLASSLSACVVAPYRAPAQPVTVIQPAPQVQRMETGRIAQIELVRTEDRAQPSGAGAVIGGITGAVLGHQIGGGFGKSAATMLGGLGGAIAGNTIEGNQQRTQVHESLRVTVQADDGSVRYFSVPTQSDLHIGERVRMANGQLFR